MDDSDFDEDEFYNKNILWQKKKSTLEMYTNRQFKRRYRFNKNTFIDIVVPLIGNFNTTREAYLLHHC